MREKKMRLINADEFKKQEVLEKLRTAEFDDEIQDVIDNIPTAYDVEKTVSLIDKTSEKMQKALAETLDKELIYAVQKLFRTYTNSLIRVVKSRCCG